MLNVDELISELSKSIASTAIAIGVLQKTNTVVIKEECAAGFVASLTKLFAKINECYTD